MTVAVVVDGRAAAVVDGDAGDDGAGDGGTVVLDERRVGTDERWRRR